MGAQRNTGPPAAVLLDALGTLVDLEPPAPLLRAKLRDRLGLEVSEAEAGRAVRTEIAYYRANLQTGRDRAGLARLRRSCARVVRDALGEPAAGAPLPEIERALLASLRFTAFPDVAPALRELRRMRIRLVVVSNWDVSLHGVLAATGLRALLDGAISSAELGSAKPRPAIFRHALGMAGAPPARTWHVGDSPEADVEGARAAGLRPVLIARDAAPEGGHEVAVIRSLAELPAMAAQGR